MSNQQGFRSLSTFKKELHRLKSLFATVPSAPPKPTFITLPYPATFNPSITAILPVHITLSRLIISVVTLANLAAISMSGICPLIPMMMRTAALT